MANGQIGTRVIRASCVALHENGHAVDEQALTGLCRNRELVTGRQVAMYVLRTHYGITVMAIGKALKRDHSSVVYSCRACENLIGRELLHGRLYTRVCELMGLDTHAHLSPAVEAKVRPPAAEFRKALPTSHPQARKPKDEGIVVKDWTPEERMLLKLQRQYPGHAPSFALRSMDPNSKSRHFQRAVNRNGYRK